MVNKFLKKVNILYNQYPIVGSLCVFFLTFSLCSCFCFSSLGSLYIDDHFFHFKYAYLLRTQGFRINNHFDWLYLTEYVSKNLYYKTSLFQIALIPFTYIKNLEIGLKINDIFWASLVLGIIYYSFRKLKVSYAFLLMLFLIVFNFSIMRLLAGRAFILALGLIFPLIYFAIQKKYYKFFIVSLIYVFWHSSTFFMPFIIAVIVEVSRYMSFKKFSFKGIGGGLFSMFLASLYFSLHSLINMFSFFKEIGSKVVLGEGIEIYKKDIFQIVSISELFMFVLFISSASVLLIYVSNRNMAEEERPKILVTVYVAFLFLLMSLAGTILINGRFMDYYGIGVVFLAGSCISYLKQKKIDIDRSLRNFLLGGTLAFLLIIGTNTFINIKRAVYLNDITPTKLVAKWISSKSSNKEKVYLYNWGDFPVVFFYNDKNIYSMGMEPRGLYEYDQNLYWKWYNIFNRGIYCDENRDCEDKAEEFANSLKNADEDQKKSINKENSRKIVESIKNDFGAKYVIVSDSNNLIKLNDDLISDSFSAKSEINGGTMWGYELK